MTHRLYDDDDYHHRHRADSWVWLWFFFLLLVPCVLVVYCWNYYDDERAYFWHRWNTERSASVQLDKSVPASQPRSTLPPDSGPTTRTDQRLVSNCKRLDGTIVV